MGIFKEWVRGFGGTRVVAKAMGKKLKTVQHWTTGYSNPKLKDAERLIKLSKGKLTLSDILDAGKQS